MRSPPPTAAMMRARRMIDAMTCRELTAAALGPPSRSAEALSRDDDAGAFWTVKTNIFVEQTLSQTDLTSALIKSEPNHTNRRLAKVSPRANNLAIFCSKLSMLHKRHKHLDVSDQCSVFWFGTADSPEAELSRISTVL